MQFRQTLNPLSVLAMLLCVALPSRAQDSKARMLIDCNRYFASALQRQFKPFEKKIGDWVPTQSGRDVEATLHQAQLKFFAQIKKLTTYEIEDIQEVLLGASMWPWSPQVKADWLKLVDQQHRKIKNLPKYIDLVTELKDIRERLVRGPMPGEVPFRVARESKRKKPTLDQGMTRDLIIELARYYVGPLIPVNALGRNLIDDLLDITVSGDSAEMWKFNAGIKDHLAREIAVDDTFFTDSLEFYSRLFEIDNLHLKNLPNAASRDTWALLFDAPTDFNVWALALEVTSGDASRAIRLLTLFGHDDQAHILNPAAEQSARPDRVAVLDVWHPMRNSYLFKNGAVDGLKVSTSTLDEFKLMLEEEKKWRDESDESKELARMQDERYRAGNYHFIGGAYIVNELYRRGWSKTLGFRLPLVAAELMGSLYKRILLDTYYLTDPLSQKLYALGYPYKKVPKPDDVTEVQYRRALADIDLNFLHLLLSREQHRKGAEWAYGKLKQ